MNVNIPINIGGLVRSSADSARTAPSTSNGTTRTAESQPTEALLPTDLVSVHSAPVEPQESATEKAAAEKAQQAREQSQKVNEYLSQAGTQLKFTVSEETGRIIISVIDTASDQVVRTIPPDTLGRLAQQAGQLRGLLFNQAG